jgi:hypothetical protein
MKDETRVKIGPKIKKGPLISVDDLEPLIRKDGPKLFMRSDIR